MAGWPLSPAGGGALVRAGPLSEPITVQSASVDTSGAYGGESKTWSTYAEYFAQILEQRGREFLAGGPQGERLAVFRIYDDSAVTITHAMRVVWRGDTYEIVGISRFGRNEGLEIQARGLID